MTMDQVFNDLLVSCRTGDIDTVDTLLSTPNLNINQTDEWDYSPLILASICGHVEIVNLLLSRGATCDRDTFEGERCIYGALNDEIRNLLLSFDISKKVDISQPFASHLSSMLNPVNPLLCKDIVFVTNTGHENRQYFSLNRFLLAARSKYCLQKLNDEWLNTSVVDLGDIDAETFGKLVGYIYLKPDSLDYDRSLVELASSWGFDDLVKSLEVLKGKNEKEKAKTNHDNLILWVEIARKNMSEFVTLIIDSKVIVNLDEFQVHQQIEQDQLIDAKEIDPHKEIDSDEEIDFDDINPQLYIQSFQKKQLLNCDVLPDVLLSVVDVLTNSLNYYPCHRAMLLRSEYFDTMFNSEIFASNMAIPVLNQDFGEIINKPKFRHLPIIKLNCTNLEVAEIILMFIYHDDINVLPLKLTIDVLFCADELFLERLKTLCAVNITSQFKTFTWNEYNLLLPRIGYNCYDIIRVSWQTRSDKLEQHMTKFIAYNLALIYRDPDESKKLRDLIEESASRIEQRQDTDTIELIDDIRYYLAKKYGVSGESSSDFNDLGLPWSANLENPKILQTAMLAYDRDVEMIDDLLVQLNLEA